MEVWGITAGIVLPLCVVIVSFFNDKRKANMLRSLGGVTFESTKFTGKFAVVIWLFVGVYLFITR